MSTPYLSAAEVAAKLGVVPSTVHRMAKRHKVGAKILGRPAFTAADLDTLRGFVRGPGCPKFKTGNQLWKRRKKSKKTSR